ncbi:MAG: sulfite exporter TauE/SafE family protein [Verrucomicrobiota bacterium]
MIPHLEITLPTLLLALTGAFVMGFAKTGLPGLALVNVIIMAHLFGRASVGIILPLLIVCDLVIYPIYRRYASWTKVWPLLPPTIVGVLGGWWILNVVHDDTTMKRIIGWTIAIMLGFQVLRDRNRRRLEKMPDTKGFLIGSGFVIGLSTTVANAAGPAYTVWGLIRRLSKEDFLGIAARYFLFVNFFKLPLFWQADVVSRRTLLIDLALLPAVLIGILIGRQVIKRMPQEAFDKILFVLSAAGTIWLIFF